jgi:DNA-binding LytR/AlgR family response regulator
MNSPALDASPNAQTLRQRAGRSVLIGIAASVVLALLGAMGTDMAPLPYRLMYWAAVIMPGSLLGIAVQTAVAAWGGLDGRRWTEVVLVSVLISVPHTFLVIVATALFFGLDAITLEVVLFFGMAVLMVALVLTAINSLAAASSAMPPPPVAAFGPPAAAPAPAAIADVQPEAEAEAEAELEDASGLPLLPDLIAEKLPMHLRGARLIAIEAEDHYLRIHTDAGSDLVLMRMTDACALLPDAAGARVHRSWWAARSAAETLKRQGSKAELTLQGGLTVPVSRTMQTALREAGWG